MLLLFLPLQLGANLAAGDDEGNTPAFFAARVHGAAGKECMKVLLQRGRLGIGGATMALAPSCVGHRTSYSPDVLPTFNSAIYLRNGLKVKERPK